MKTLKFRYFSVSIKIIIVYTAIIAVFAVAFFATYYISKVEIGNQLTKINEEYFSNKVSYIEATFKDIKNNAYDLRIYIGEMLNEIDNDSLKKSQQIDRLTRVVNYYNYLDDIFIYDSSTGYLISTQGSMDVEVYFRMQYFEKKLADKWNDIVNGNEDITINVTKFPDNEAASRKDYFKRLLYVDIDYFKNSKVIVGFVMDIEKVIRNESYKNADINNFFVIKNDTENALQSFLYNNLEYIANENSLKNEKIVNILKIENNIMFYQFDTKRQLIYLNVVNMEKYFERLGYYNVLPVIIISLLLILVIIVASSFLGKFYRNLKSIKSFIEGGFVKSILTKQPGINFMEDIKDFIGISGIEQICVLMLGATIKSINVHEIETHDYYTEFSRFLNKNGIRHKSFNFIKLKRIYIVDAKSIKSYSEVLKSMQKFLNEYSSREVKISVNLFVSGIFEEKDGIEKAVDEVVYLSDNVPVKISNKVILLEKDIQEDYKYMPDEFYNMLRNTMVCADKQAAADIIRDVIDNNIRNGTGFVSFKATISKINSIIMEVIFERFTDCYDEAVMVINKINNLLDEVSAEYMILFYEELLEKINLVSLPNENKGKGKLQQCFINYIEENFNKDIYLETMAEYFNLSPKYVSSKFKEITGSNFTEYLSRYRINAAKELLTKTQQKVNQISEKVGYNNVNVFIRHFKSIEGITPKSYREIN